MDGTNEITETSDRLQADGGEIFWERELPSIGNVSGNGLNEKDSAANDKKGIGLGIDAGGTYTDSVLYDFDNGVIISKSKAPTTKWNFTVGITESLKAFDSEILKRVGITVVSTTLATNAIVENAGRGVGLMVMPPGKISTGEISHDPWRIVGGRLNIQGDELEPVSENEIKRTAAELIKNHDVEAFAVSGYGSTINPVHEIAIKRIIEEETGLGVCCGHELSSTLNFFVRATTAVLNAGIIPLIEQFIEELEISLEKMNINRKIMIVRGDGSLMSRKAAIRHPVETTLSGPAASITGARFLTGSPNAMIIDVGGTTSDIGIITDGRIRLTEEGAKVGRWRTHIRAVDMSTLGTGGDSRILIDKGELKTGPGRVAPVGILHSIKGHSEAVDYLSKIHQDFYTSTAAMEIFSLTGKAAAWQLSPEEEKIVNVLSGRPHSAIELSNKIKHGLWNMLKTARLEQSAVIQRYGLTPTDLLTAKAEVSLWPSKISEKILDLYSTVQKMERDSFTEMIFRSIADNLLRTIVLQELEAAGEEAEMISGHKTFKILLEKLKGNSNALSLVPSLKVDLIGVGAAAPWLLKELADHLGSRLIIPEDGDVANALGAVSSKVTVRQTGSVLPLPNGKFLVNGLKKTSRFETYDMACEHMENTLAAEIIEKAAANGTGEKEILWTAENITSTAGNGICVFLGREYSAEITGPPV